MARGTFSSANYLSASDNRWTDYPASQACWWNTSSNTAAQDVIGLSDTATANNYAEISLGFNIANDPVQNNHNVGGSFGTASINTGTGPTNEWHNAMGISTSATLRDICYDGTKGTSSTTSRAWPSGVDDVHVGIRKTSAVGTALSGYAAEAAQWNVALTDAECMAYAHGVSPMLIRPTALKNYWPLFKSASSGDAKNWVNGPNLTMTGTVGAADHPAKTFAYPVP